MTDLRQQLEQTLSGTYTLGHELGGGGMSRVFVADELRLGRKVVVKVLSPELAAGISADRFEREIKLAASLQQANIVPVLSAGDTNGLPFYTMPFVEGESLRARLGKPVPLSAAEVVRILGDVARALQYAHERGIVHRDIKPDNVLLSGGTAVVTDFGIAKALSASRTQSGGATLTQLGTSIGTPAYMAPEQAAGDPDIDSRADIYAFGCMAYELLTGRAPFHGRTPQRVLAAHMGELPQPIFELRPGLSPTLADLIMRCLAKEPGDRPQNAAEIARTLDVVTSGGGMDAMPPVLLHGPAAFRKALFVYVIAALGVTVVAKAATIVIGLPDWVFPGAIIIMALGLPVILFTGYVQSVTRRALTATPRLTPGGGSRAQGTMATIALKASPHLSWKRTTRGGAMALGAFVALIVAFMIMRAFGIGPAASLFAAGTLKARDPVMIAGFGVSRADSSVGRVVAEAVRTNLSQSPSIVLATPSAMAGALRRMQRPANTAIDLNVARDIAARQGYKAIVTGDVTGLGNGFVVALRLVTADSSGTVLASYQTTVNGPADLVTGVDEIAKKLRGKMGESLRSVQASPPLAQVSTASLEALKAYTLGEYANDVQSDPVTATGYLREAVKLDTNFAMAWRKLAVTLGNSSAPQAAIDSAITHAHNLPDRLTERERLRTAGYYFDHGPGRDRAKAVAAYESLLKLGDTAGAANNLGVLVVSRREFARSESLYRADIRAQPDVAIAWSNVLPDIRGAGRHDEAMRDIDDLRKRFPGNWNWDAEAISELYNGGHVAEAAAELDTARNSKRAGLRNFSLMSEVQLALLHGQLKSAESWHRQLLAFDSTVSLSLLPGEAAMRVDSTLVWYVPTDPRLLRSLDSIAPLITTGRAPADRDYGNLAAAYARMGRPDRARAVLTRMRTEVKDTSLLRAWEPQTHLAQGEIALAEQHGVEAASEFRKADQLPDGPVSPSTRPLEFSLARAFDVANQPDSSIAHYERFLSAPSAYKLWDDSQWLAGAYNRLGELYEAKGDKSRAESYLMKFVDLWSKADPELQPKVQQAKQRLARLRDREGR
jgi:eukaryotic-like serine/threonine-protein kinase